jgi:hypothetical protein
VCLAALAAVLVGGWVFDYHDPNTDAAGRGLAGAYVAVVDVFAFFAIGALLVMCGSRAAFSTPWGVLAVVTFLCAAAALIIFTVVGPAKSAGRNRDRIMREAYNAQLETNKRRADEVSAWIDRFKSTPDAPYFASVERKGDSFTIDTRWLQQNGCDCKEGLAMLEENVRLYPDPYAKKFFIDELLRQQGKPEE